jgi:putative acetyltransferase
MHIRAESLSDVAAIHGVTQRAFNGAPHSDGSEPHIISALRDAGALAMSLVAEVDGVVVGHVAVSAVTITDGTAAWYGLGPISVEPGRQGQGIGSLMMRAALHRLTELGAAGCVVLGDPAYYSRFGFVARPSLVYPGVPPEYFMALSFGASQPQGEVAYHAAFTSAV